MASSIGRIPTVRVEPQPEPRVLLSCVVNASPRLTGGCSGTGNALHRSSQTAPVPEARGAAAPLWSDPRQPSSLSTQATPYMRRNLHADRSRDLATRSPVLHRQPHFQTSGTKAALERMVSHAAGIQGG